MARYEEMGGQAPYLRLKECIRVNTSKISAEELIPRLEAKGVKLEKVPFLKNGYYVISTKFSVSALPEYLIGYYYIQEAASQLPAEVLNPNKNDIILDCCAAPGSKATQLAEKAKYVVALEPNNYRRIALLNNIERLSLGNTIVCEADARYFQPSMKFRKILADVPCSGNYLVEKGWFEKQTLDNIRQRSELQKDILKSMANILEDGGEIVYSTCSMEPEEDEMVIDWAIKTLKLKVLEANCIGDNGLTNVLGKALDSSVSRCKRLWPHKTGTQGFFIARLTK